MTAADAAGRIEKKYLICWLIINKPQPNLPSGDTSVQGTLTLVRWLSPE